MSFPELTSAQGPPLTRAEGKLPDGTPWEIVVPSNWNGTLLVDLDFASSQQRYALLYARGFAGAGILEKEAPEMRRRILRGSSPCSISSPRVSVSRPVPSRTADRGAE